MTVHPLNGFPAIRVRSREEYKEITGENFDPKHLAARWNKALATGSKNGLIMPYVNIYGPANRGQAVPFNGVGSATEQGVLIHELGHAMSLPHWGNSSVQEKSVGGEIGTYKKDPMQGGRTKYRMLAISSNPLDDPLDNKSYSIQAINIPADDGTVTEVKLLSTPDAEKAGLPNNPEVLYT